MGEPALKRWTYAEYLAFEEASAEKHELCEGVVLPLLVALVVDEIYEGVVLAPPTPRPYAERVEPL